MKHAMIQKKDTQKLRILAFFFSSFALDKKPDVWGGERAFIELIQQLKAQIVFDVFEKRSSILRLLFQNSIGNLFEVNGVIQAFLKILSFRLYASYYYNVIYAYNNAFTNVISAFLASKILAKPFIINVFHVEKYQMKPFFPGYKTARNLYGFNRRSAVSVNLIWPLIRRILTYAYAITVPSKATSSDLQSMGICQKKIFVIPLGLEHERIEHPLKTVLRKEFDGIYIGRISPNKGIFDTLHSWKIVVTDKPSVKLAIVNGKGDQKLDIFLKKHNLNKNVVLFDRLSTLELTNVLLRSKLLIIPSYTEGFSFTVGKALLHRVPVVSYNIPVLCEVYGAFPQITFVQEGAIELLARELLQNLSKETPTNWLSTQSSLLETYSWRHTANTFYNLLVALN
jgi:glycosyltransferase involved in cell wall biosynthesis